MKLDALARLYPTRVVNRVCKIATTQPFGRCHVTFKYFGRNAPVNIYEEFTFNEFGEITFIEAWPDSPEISAMAEANTIKRLSTNRDIADLGERIKHPIYYWFKELLSWFYLL
jgi:hypothetical protein